MDKITVHNRQLERDRAGQLNAITNTAMRNKECLGGQHKALFRHQNGDKHPA